MITSVVQRWRDRRSAYRPAGEVIDPHAYEVAPIDNDRTAKAFVLAHHYAGSYPSARFRFGLYRRGILVGVAVFSHPMQNKVLTRVFPGDAKASVELGRFVLLDDVPGNGETWFLARCFELLRRVGLHGILSHADPVARANAAGELVFPGHLGTIYQAHNGIYLGRATRRTLRLLPDATVICARTISKIRARERNWQSSALLLERHGAAELGEHEDAVRWLATWIPRLTRPLTHPGNYRYVWALDKAMRRHLPAGLPFPKLTR